METVSVPQNLRLRARRCCCERPTPASKPGTDGPQPHGLRSEHVARGAAASRVQAASYWPLRPRPRSVADQHPADAVLPSKARAGRSAPWRSRCRSHPRRRQPTRSRCGTSERLGSRSPQAHSGRARSVSSRRRPMLVSVRGSRSAGVVTDHARCSSRVKSAAEDRRLSATRAQGVLDHLGLVDPGGYAGGYGRARFAALIEIDDFQALPMPEEGLEPPTRGL
jgi:hypothetical protein